jgi:hypothetical protein
LADTAAGGGDPSEIGIISITHCFKQWRISDFKAYRPGLPGAFGRVDVNLYKLGRAFSVADNHPRQVKAQQLKS